MKEARIFTNDFNRMIEAVKNFCSKDNIRKQYNFIRLEFNSEQNKVTAIGLDGFRVAVENSIISECNEDFSCYVKANIKLPREQFATIALEENEEEAIIRCSGFAIAYEQPKEREFLDWRKVIPSSEVKYKIGFNGNYLLQALQAAKTSLGGNLREPVILEFRSNLEPIVLRTNKEDIKLVLPIRIKDERYAYENLSD